MKPHEIEAYARTLIGTPYRHQGRGLSIDCAGVIVSICEHFKFPYHDVEGYPRSGRGELLTPFIEHADFRDKDIGVGLIYVMSRGRGTVPQHLGIGTKLPDGRDGMVHANDSIGHVNETSFKRWHKRHLCTYAFRGVAWQL